MLVNGTITRKPVVRDKVIFSSIRSDDHPDSIEIVLFRNSRPQEYTSILQDLNVNDNLTFEARLERNPTTGQNQLIIDRIGSDQEEDDYDYSDMHKAIAELFDV